MESESTYRHGQVVWRELLCPPDSLESARAFYGKLLGWTFEETSTLPGGVYTLAKLGDRPIAGIYPLASEMGPPAWLSYVSVKDVDEVARAARANGGKVLVPPKDIEGVGRLAVLGDPTGGALGVMRNRTSDPRASGPADPGDFCWETLGTTDVEKAKGFYTKVLGWDAGEAHEGMVIVSVGAAQVADLAPTGAPTRWLCHVVVKGLEAARDEAQRLGAKVVVPAANVASIGRLSVIADPAGAVLSLFEPGTMGGDPPNPPATAP